jgi:beta-galactosidase/beta-glucuronidase
MYPHRIRIRGPWDYEPLESHPATGSLPPAGQMTLPCRWRDGGLGDFVGRVRFRRRFGYPGRLDAHERVWLTFAGVEAVADVWLNEAFLGRHEGGEPFEFEVTPLLRTRNELRVDAEGEGDGGLWGEVALEVRSTA